MNPRAFVSMPALSRPSSSVFGRRPVATEQMRAGERAFGAFVRRRRDRCATVEREDDGFVDALGAGGVGVENEFHALGFERALQFGGNFGILARNDLRAVLDDGDARAEAANICANSRPM